MNIITFLKHLMNSNFISYILFYLFFLTSCNIGFLDRELNDTINNIEKNANKISSEVWTKYDKEIEHTKEQLKVGRDKYTPEETEKMNKLIGKYYALKAKHKVGNLKQDLQDATQQLEGAYDAIFNDAEGKKIKTWLKTN